jgi:hypothetical protein
MRLRRSAFWVLVLLFLLPETALAQPAGVIHEGTFKSGRPETRRPEIEFEQVMGLLAKGSSLTPITLSDFEDMWKPRERLRRVTGLVTDEADLRSNWPLDSRYRVRLGRDPETGTKKVSGMVCLRIEPDRVEMSDGEYSIDPEIDLFDDFYFDTRTSDLLKKQGTLRMRRRWDDKDRPRRLLVSYKRQADIAPALAGILPGGLKATRETERRRDFPRGATSDEFLQVAREWDTDLRSGRVVINPAKGPEDLSPVYDVYEDLKPNLGNEGIVKAALRLVPKAFVRSLRGRWHYRECSRGELRSLYRSGRQAIAEISASGGAEPWIELGREILSGELLQERVVTELGGDKKGAERLERIEGLGMSPEVEDLLSNGTQGVRSPEDENEVSDLVEAMNVKEAATDVVSDAYDALAHQIFACAPKNETCKAHVGRARVIEEAAAALRMLWFDEAREFYVPTSDRSDNEDLIIDTIDFSYAYRACSWSVAIDKQAPNASPNEGPTGHVFVNEVQLEVSRAKPFLDRIAELEALDGESKKKNEPMLKGAQLVLSRYLEMLPYLTEVKREELEKATKTGGWKTLPVSKGQLAINWANEAGACP